MSSLTANLPLDIWIYIYSLLPACFDSYRELAPYMLISKLSYDCIHPRLFETMHVYPKYMNRIRKWISEVPEVLEGAVRRVHITCDTYQLPPGDGGDSIANLLKICTNTQRLACWVPSPLLEHAAIAQAIICLPNLRFLEINVLQLSFILRGCNSTPQSPLFHLYRLAIYFWSTTKEESLQALRNIDLGKFEFLTQVGLVAYSYPDAIISTLLQVNLPSALQDIIVFASVPWECEHPDDRVLYYKRSAVNPETYEKNVQSELELRERPRYRRGEDFPLDDWAEITFCPGLAVWSWAREAKKDGKKVFTRPIFE
ncbi:hypothetical protein DL96DRAFT_1814104 [Flagelloscypha sp. PMI_526]|nr:hypothetical protein DL96DRAFT_1814104 [Flagelloscypha sp. PMI_526]